MCKIKKKHLSTGMMSLNTFDSNKTQPMFKIEYLIQLKSFARILNIGLWTRGSWTVVYICMELIRV